MVARFEVGKRYRMRPSPTLDPATAPPPAEFTCRLVGRFPDSLGLYYTEGDTHGLDRNPADWDEVPPEDKRQELRRKLVEAVERVKAARAAAADAYAENNAAQAQVAELAEALELLDRIEAQAVPPKEDR